MRGAQQPSALVTKTGRVVVSSPPSWLPDRVDVPADTDRFTLTSGVEVAVEALENGEAVKLWKVDRSRPVPPQAKLRALTLGRRRASLQQIGGTVELSPRHSEILTLLMLHPEGLTGKELALEIYGSNDQLLCRVPLPASSKNPSASRNACQMPASMAQSMREPLPIPG